MIGSVINHAANIRTLTTQQVSIAININSISIFLYVTNNFFEVIGYKKKGGKKRGRSQHADY